MAKGKKKGRKGTPTIENRRARHDYEILETLEVGIVLVGSEVKALREGTASLAEGYVAVNAEPPTLTLCSIHIGDYGPAGPGAHQHTRDRGLLAKKREIAKLARQVEQKGVTIVPLKLYFNEAGIAKLLVGVARGRARHDKRDAIRDREVERDISRAMSRRV